jgi:hypothetical protein
MSSIVASHERKIGSEQLDHAGELVVGRQLSSSNAGFSKSNYDV